MIERNILPALGNMFASIVGWVTDIIEAVDGKDVIIAGFLLTLIIGLLFIPLRGHSLVGLINDFTMTPVNKTFYKKSFKRKYDIRKQVRKGG